MKQIGKYIGLYIILGIVPIILMAQSATSLIVGKVMDESKMPLPYASVSIYRSGKPLNGVITDDNGRFSIKTQQSENPCKLMVDFVGYVKMEIEVVPNQPKVDMGTILLKENAIALGEVTVTGKEEYWHRQPGMDKQQQFVGGLDATQRNFLPMAILRDYSAILSSADHFVYAPDEYGCQTEVHERSLDTFVAFDGCSRHLQMESFLP